MFTSFQSFRRKLCATVIIFFSFSFLLFDTETPSAPSITVSPTTFDFNDAVTLTCNPATAGSSYTYVWSRDGTTLSETGSQLIIGSFAAVDTGTYTCAVVDQGVTSPVSADTTVTASCELMAIKTDSLCKFVSSQS